MVDIPMPGSLCPNSSSWGILSSTASFQSNFTGATWTAGSRFSLWTCTLSFTNMSEDSRADLQAWILALNGQENRAIFNDHAYRQRGVGGGAPQVNGAGQTGASLTFNGAASALDYFKAGDMFVIGDELKMVTGDVDTVAGAGIVGFKPNLRTSPANNEPLNITPPLTARFILQGNEHTWSNVPGPQTPFSNVSLSFVEDIL